jgi:hypothetical protein
MPGVQRSGQRGRGLGLGLGGHDPRLRAQRLDRAGDAGRQAAAVRDYDRVRVRQIFEDLQADRPVPAITPAPWTCACRESRPRL